MGNSAQRESACGPDPRRGQGLVEYALIIALVALIVVGALALIGPVVASALQGVSPAL